MPCPADSPNSLHRRTVAVRGRQRCTKDDKNPGRFNLTTMCVLGTSPYTSVSGRWIKNTGTKMRRLNISHVTEYRFSTSVALLPHRLRLRPLDSHSLRIESSML